MKKTLIVLFTVLLLATGANAAFEKVNTYENNFTDVSDSNWFSDNVKSAYELGFMNGKSEGKFDPNGNVTVAEGITMASRVHAIYNGTEVKKRDSAGNELRFGFDTTDGLAFSSASGEVEDGVLVLRSTGPAKNGAYDLGVSLNNLDFKARDYSKMTVRMKRDYLENESGFARKEQLEVYFQTSNDLGYDAPRCVRYNLPSDLNLEDWFEVEIELSKNELWKDDINRIRFDPTNNNGIYYIDYIVFSKSEDTSLEKWYDMYVDYAVDNNIIENDTFKSDDYNRNITRAEMVNLFAAALPEEYFAPINKVNGIPDMDKNDYYADIVLMLYKAGVVLGSDEAGTFKPESDIKRSEVAAIINRVALPENRVKGEITSDWDGMYYIHDLEFDNPDELDSLFKLVTDAEIKDGHIILTPIFMEDRKPNYDPMIGKLDTSIRADEFSTLKVRIKMDFEGEVSNMKGEFYFLPEGVENFNEKNALKPNFDSNYYVDAAGWRVYTFNLLDNDTWKGNITGFRLDPTNNAGTFTIDYIRFVRSENTMIITDEELMKNYTSRELFDDEAFENGFVVIKTDSGKRELDGIWTYNEGTEPKWQLDPWWTNTTFFEDKDETTDKYTLADKTGTKVVKYNPEEKSLSMRLNADKVYCGKGHTADMLWPHLLIEQDFYDDDYSKVPEEEKARLDLGSDKIYAEMDVRLVDFKDLDGENKDTASKSACSFLVYYYVAHKKIPDMHAYFGLVPFHSKGTYSSNVGWHKDTHSSLMIYNIPMDETFGSLENAIWQADGNYPIGEWKKIRFDITPQIENLVNLINKDNVLGREVSRDDLWMSGVNVGFEIWGNYQCEVEIKNFNVICYDKIEQ